MIVYDVIQNALIASVQRLMNVLRVSRIIFFSTNHASRSVLKDILLSKLKWGSNAKNAILPVPFVETRLQTTALLATEVIISLTSLVCSALIIALNVSHKVDRLDV